MFGSDFLSSDSSNLIKIQVMFGVEGIDRGNFNEYIPAKNRGTAILDNDFDITSEGCQKVFIKACQDIETFKCTSKACGASQLLARDNTTICFMSEFRNWASSTYSLDTYTMNSSTFTSKLDEFRGTDATLHGAPVDWRNYIGFTSDNEVKFGYFEFTATMKALAPMADKEEVLAVSNSFVNHIKGYPECTSQCDCSSVFQTTNYAWIWYHTEKALEFGFYQGITIAFPVAFGVLLFATKNVVISFYAITAVYFIVFGVLGFAYYALSWPLGVAESIAGIIIIGFSVDYTVHIGHMYQHAGEVGIQDRRSRFEFAARKMFLTVLGGAITTVGAGVFMFACQIVFFNKMATLIVGTIVLSFLYATGFFLSILFVAGPEGDTGDIVGMYEKVKDYYQRNCISPT